MKKMLAIMAAVCAVTVFAADVPAPGGNGGPGRPAGNGGRGPRMRHNSTSGGERDKRDAGGRGPGGSGNYSVLICPACHHHLMVLSAPRPGGERGKRDMGRGGRGGNGGGRPERPAEK